jgi:hypothetical protein
MSSNSKTTKIKTEKFNFFVQVFRVKFTAVYAQNSLKLQQKY